MTLPRCDPLRLGVEQGTFSQVPAWVRLEKALQEGQAGVSLREGDLTLV